MPPATQLVFSARYARCGHARQWPPGARYAIMVSDAAVAQLAEQRTFNPKVVGSIPTGGIGIGLEIRLVRSLDLEPAGCRHRRAGLIGHVECAVILGRS